MTVVKWLLAAALIYGCFVALLYFAQRSMMYFPDTTRTPPAAAGLPQAEELTLTAADGEKLVAWHVPPAEGRPIIVYFQGNGGGPNLRARRFRNLAADGFGLLALCYRGYGGSTGSPSETGLLLDAAAAYEFAATRYGPTASSCGANRSAPAWPWRSRPSGRWHACSWNRRSHRPWTSRRPHIRSFRFAC